MNRKVPKRLPASPASRAVLWTARLLAAERALLLAGVAADQRVLWLGPTAVERVNSGQAVLELCPGSPRRLVGDLAQPVGDWPYLNDSLDQVVLQHLDETGQDTAALIEEALRVLRPEGSLWLFGCGRWGWPRFRLCWPGAKRRQILGAATPLAWSKRLIDRGCVDIVAQVLCRDADSNRLLARPLNAWSSPLILLHARKRRGANIQDGRRRLLFAAPPLRVLGASPASRTGLAA